MRVLFTVDGFFAECQWTGVLIKERYGYPGPNGERIGCFKNAGCAVAYYSDLKDRSRLEKKKYAKIITLIYNDLNLQSRQQPLCAAPRLNLTSDKKPDWSWLEKCPWMEQPATHVPITENDYQKNRKEKASSKGDLQDGSSDKKMMHIYWISADPKNPKIDHQKFDLKSQHHLGKSLREDSQIIYYGTFRSREVTVFWNSKGPVNEFVNNMFRTSNQNQKKSPPVTDPAAAQQPNFTGDVMILSKKELPFEGEEELNLNTGKKRKKSETSLEGGKTEKKNRVPKISISKELEHCFIDIPTLSVVPSSDLSFGSSDAKKRKISVK